MRWLTTNPGTPNARTLANERSTLWQRSSRPAAYALPTTSILAVGVLAAVFLAVDIALVNASTALIVDDAGTVTRSVVALGSVAPVIVRSDAAAELLAGKPLDQLDDAVLAAAGEAAAADAKPISDVRASAEYRRDMVKVMTRRSIADCIEQLKG